MASNDQKSLLQFGIEYLKGVGPQRGETLKKELGIYTFYDLLMHLPYRYIDRTKFHNINDICDDGDEAQPVQLRGTLRRLETLGEGSKLRLVGKFRDETGSLDLVWFKGIRYMEQMLQIGAEYVVYGKPTFFNDAPNLAHPEIELLLPENTTLAPTLDPVYSTTEKLKSKSLDAKGIRKLVAQLFEKLSATDLPENLPGYLLQKLKFPSRFEAMRLIHFPSALPELETARNRLKFEELFFLQLKLLQTKGLRKETVGGYIFAVIGERFNRFYKEKLSFDLTNAQKKVLREVRYDLGSGKQMNRLLQGDVGSGKTVCALMSMLIAVDNGFQACLMAPTEILAQQHFASICESVEDLGVRVRLLVGSIKGKKRDGILADLEAGDVDLLIGTHALIEETVVFKNLGLAIVDEQHRFGVVQRAQLWKKANPLPPHVLVMTATPIPRTLAMTLYGDLDVSVIDEMPPGRKPVKTIHKTENSRLRVYGLMREQIEKGHQVYVVYPLIEESEKLDLNNLMQGYESISAEFPAPQYQISIVHGKMKPAEKDFEMQRFVSGVAQIMVATTVIEVGVNVPNATLMVIENTERFGLAQLHQLRGRVGRGGGEAYCVLVSSVKLTTEARQRIETMCSTNNGFEIAEMDMKIRGAGNITGTQQSGVLSFKLADLSKDVHILQTAREIAHRILEKDKYLALPIHQPLKSYLEADENKAKGWGRIS